MTEEDTLQVTIGWIVHYTLSEQDAEQINRRRSDYVAFLRHRHEGSVETGFQGHVGNSAAAGEVYPAIVVRTFGGDYVNLQVLLDGSDSYWATSRREGEGPNTWSWPPKV
jgi:hypothetical protein